MTSLRRYEILLPLRFNDGKAVPDSLIERTVTDLEERFTAVSWETQTVRGIWQQKDVSYEPAHARICGRARYIGESRVFCSIQKYVEEALRPIGYLDHIPSARRNLTATFFLKLRFPRGRVAQSRGLKNTALC
jgi:hypothetical protein